MRKTLATGVLIVSLLSPVRASAQTQRETPANATFANNQWAIDITSPQIDYRETNASGTVLDTETGRQYGWQTSFSLQQHWLFPRLYLNATLLQSYGTIIHGESNPAFNGSPTLGNTRDRDFRAGVGVGLGGHIQITPYLGGGQHYWERELTGSGGYLENYQHDYAGGGMLVQFSPARRLVFSGYGFHGVTFNAQLATQYFPFVSCSPFLGCSVHVSMNEALGPEPMSMAGVAADIALSPRWHANVGADWNSFRYGHSALVPLSSTTHVMEPDSRTQNLTVKAGIGYAF